MRHSGNTYQNLWIGYLHGSSQGLNDTAATVTKYFAIANFQSEKLALSICDGIKAWTALVTEQHLAGSNYGEVAIIKGSRMQRLRDSLENATTKKKEKVIVVLQEDGTLQIQLLMQWGDSGVEVLLAKLSLNENSEGVVFFVDLMLDELQKDEEKSELLLKTINGNEKESGDCRKTLAELKKVRSTFHDQLIQACVNTINSVKFK